MTTQIRDRRFLPALVATIVAAFLVIPMVTNTSLVRAQSQEEDPCDGVPRSTFEDRNEADPAHRPSIDCVDFYDISSGDETGRFFRPDQRVDRGQMATFVVNTLEAAGLEERLPDGDPPDEFDDISGTVHRENINILARIGVVQGNNGQYNPEVQINRAQMATFLLQAKEWAYQTEYEPRGSYFGDVRPSNAHFDNINAAYEEDLVRGTEEPEEGVPNSGSYEPGRTVRRQNMASFLSNLLHQVWDAPEQFCPPSSPSPTSSPNGTASPQPTSTASAAPSPTSSASAEPSPTSSAAILPLPLSAAQQESPTPTASPESTSSPCATPSGSASPTPSGSPTPRPSGSASPTASPTPTEDECPVPDPTGIICPDPEPSESATPTTSPSPTRSATAAAVPLPLDL